MPLPQHRPRVGQVTVKKPPLNANGAEIVAGAPFAHGGATAVPVNSIAAFTNLPDSRLPISVTRRR